MIVYPAYQMYKTEEKYTGPDLWKNGVVNYPYKVSGNAQFSAQYNRFSIPQNDYVEFSGIPANLYTTIELFGYAAESSCTVSVVVGGVELGKILWYPEASTKTFTIPENLRVKNQTIKLLSVNKKASVISATLS